MNVKLLGEVAGKEGRYRVYTLTEQGGVNPKTSIGVEKFWGNSLTGTAIWAPTVENAFVADAIEHFIISFSAQEEIKKTIKNRVAALVEVISASLHHDDFEASNLNLSYDELNQWLYYLAVHNVSDMRVTPVTYEGEPGWMFKYRLEEHEEIEETRPCKHPWFEKVAF